jgi:polyhydroxyalkanoate synthesis regulator phasin
MTTPLKTAREAIHDKIESQIKTAQAKLEALKARAEATKAITELRLIGELVTERHAIDRKLKELKSSTESTYQRAKTDVESRVADLEKSVQAIEAKFKTA